MAPTESAGSADETGIPSGTGAPDCVLDSALADELWHGCDAARWGLTRDEFEQILLDAGTAQNFGQMCIRDSGCAGGSGFEQAGALRSL